MDSQRHNIGKHHCQISSGLSDMTADHKLGSWHSSQNSDWNSWTTHNWDWRHKDCLSMRMSMEVHHWHQCNCSSNICNMQVTNKCLGWKSASMRFDFGSKHWMCCSTDIQAIVCTEVEKRMKNIALLSKCMLRSQKYSCLKDKAVSRVGKRVCCKNRAFQVLLPLWRRSLSKSYSHLCCW